MRDPAADATRRSSWVEFGQTRDACQQDLAEAGRDC